MFYLIKITFYAILVSGSSPLPMGAIFMPTHYASLDECQKAIPTVVEAMGGLIPSCELEPGPR